MIMFLKFNESYHEKAVGKIINNVFYYGRVITTYKNLIAESKEEILQKDKDTTFEIKQKGLKTLITADYTKIFKEASIFKPIISYDLFYQCHSAKKDRNNGDKKRKHAFPYKKSIKCVCGRSITANYTKDKRYIYYHCTKTERGRFKGVVCDEGSLEIKDLEKEIEKKIFSKLVLKEIDRKLLEGMILKEIKELEFSYDQAVEDYDLLIKKEEEKFIALTDKYASGNISDLVWKSIEENYLSNKNKLEQKKENCKPILDSEVQERNDFIRRVSGLFRNWKVLNLDEKTDIFPELVSNSILKGKKLINISLSPLGEYLKLDDVTFGSPKGNRTPVAGMRIQCPNH